jgi:hypothetical protein
MMPENKADDEERCAGHRTEDASWRAIDEMREPRAVKGFVPGHGRFQVWARSLSGWRNKWPAELNIQLRQAKRASVTRRFKNRSPDAGLRVLRIEIL